MVNCIFCDIVAGRLPAHILYQDDAVLAFLDIHPFTPGHTLVIPRRHLPHLADLDDTTAAQVFNVARQVAAALRRSDSSTGGVNLFLSDGEVAGQEIFHLHLHVFPRSEGDSLGPGRPFGRAPAAAAQADLAAVADRLRTAFEAGALPPHPAAP